MGPVRRRPARLPRRLAIHLTRTINGVTVVEFLDYQCPACAAYYGNVTKKLEADYAGKITFVTRNFSLQGPPARPARRPRRRGSGETGQVRRDVPPALRQLPELGTRAGRQAGQRRRGTRTTQFDSYAAAIGLNLDRFHTDTASSAVQQRIDADLAAGAKVGITSTPTIFVDGKRFEPQGRSFTDVDRELRDMIDRASR